MITIVQKKNKELFRLDNKFHGISSKIVISSFFIMFLVCRETTTNYFLEKDRLHTRRTRGVELSRELFLVQENPLLSVVVETKERFQRFGLNKESSRRSVGRKLSSVGAVILVIHVIIIVGSSIMSYHVCIVSLDVKEKGVGV